SEDRIFIVTTKDQVKLMKQELPEIGEGNIIAEPCGKNTAPCIGLGALFIGRKDPDAVMGVFPSDHLIRNLENFKNAISLGEKIAKDSGVLVTFGTKPVRPETGYGYIQFCKQEEEEGVYRVKTFAEKPHLSAAKRFMASGDFLWNSGIFLWKVASILKEIEDSLPELYDSLMQIDAAIDTPDYQKVLKKAYAQIRSESIDYGVMEKSQNVYVVRADFEWNDMGSWESVYEVSRKDENRNVLDGETLCLDTKGSLIYTTNKLVATIGLSDIIVINTKDVTLIAKKGRSQEVKQVVESLARDGRKKYL
ncbi:MAG: mannose-1-phosphate guanylyltransferase, partial [Fidelibacterota bacterium]